jgi:metal-responsive CopG/Arc/MetJ family transcriptional regulator
MEVVISFIRISKELSRKLELAAKKEGVSRAELIRRAVEKYVSKIIDERPKNAGDI